MNKTFLITGAGGFLGNTILRRLSASGRDDVRALLLPGDDTLSIKGVACELYRGDITRPDTLRDVFRKPPHGELTVIHCAALVSIKRKADPRVFQVNVEGTGNLIQKCLETDARLLCVNSVHAIPEPDDDREIVEVGQFSPDAVAGLYAKSKAAAAQLVLDAVKREGLRGVILHPSALIGPGDYGCTHMTALVLAAMRGRLPMVVKGGYDFTDVRDVADGILAAAEKGRDGECYILSNRYVSIQELVDTVCRHSHRKQIDRVIPLSLARFLAPLCEAYYAIRKETPLFTRYSLETLQAKSRFSHEKAARELGYRVRDLDRTVFDTVQWLASQGR